MAADALATAVMVLGPEKGLELVKGLNGFDVVIIIEEKGGGLKLETSIGARKKYGFKEI
jgi:thiamine biosynthesis lipoprotein